MQYRHVHILAALFLVAGMTLDFVVSYRNALNQVEESMALKLEVAQERLLFHLYDAYAGIEELEQLVDEHGLDEEALLAGTRNIMKRYPQFYTSFVCFPEYRCAEADRWFAPCSYRQGDSIYSKVFGDENHDYFQRAWYKGALASGENGYWSQAYNTDENFDELIFTYSDDKRDADGRLECVVGLDFSIAWLQGLLESMKPYDDAVCVLYSSDGTQLTSSAKGKGDRAGVSEVEWIVTRRTLNPLAIDLVVAVPRRHVWESIRWGILLPLVVFILGIAVVGVLIRRILHGEQKEARLATEKEVMSRELHIAHEIQMSILRRDFPNDEEVEVEAALLPMRDVGGDLYDFHRDGDELWFIIGDVSGKGVAAALFMSATVNLFRSALRHQHSPKAIVKEMNGVLSANNPSLTFVTAFIGRLHIPSGQLLYCNAAHVVPLVVGDKRSGEGVRSIDPEPNIPLGYDGRYKFVEQGCMLGEGEKLVLYTDGVTEARDATRKMMGKRQWMEIVAHDEGLLEAVKEYIGGADPTDDITILTICKRCAAEPVWLRVPNRQDQLPLLRRTLHEFGVCSGIERRKLKQMEVAAEEAMVNIMSYSHATEIELGVKREEADAKGEEPVAKGDRLIVTLTDNGDPFDPTAQETNPQQKIRDREIGGLGISLLREIADELHYHRRNEKNELTIIKNI